MNVSSRPALLAEQVPLLLAKLGVGRLLWAPPVGAAAGLIVAISALEIRRRLIPPKIREASPLLNGHAHTNGKPADGDGQLTGITGSHPSGDLS